ncbi:MAG: YiiD C-terminal domain-containing protein, partial [Gammaproteobacteria bacterium]
MDGLIMERAQAHVRLSEYLHHSIPLIAHMGVEVCPVGEDGIRLRAPLAPNSNHIGTAFGGSLHGLATLACWGLVW